MDDLSTDITTLIPQRPPFVMIDRLTTCDETVASTALLVKDDNIFVEDGRLTEPGLVENIAQTAAARAGYVATSGNKPVQLGYIGAIKNLVIHSLPLVNDELATEISIVNQVFDVTFIQGKISCNNALLATCEMKIFIAPSK